MKEFLKFIYLTFVFIPLFFSSYLYAKSTVCQNALNAVEVDSSSAYNFETMEKIKELLNSVKNGSLDDKFRYVSYSDLFEPGEIKDEIEATLNSWLEDRNEPFNLRKHIFIHKLKRFDNIISRDKIFFNYLPRFNESEQVVLIQNLLDTPRYQKYVLNSAILNVAVRYGDVDLVKLLLDRGAEVNMKSYGDAPLHSAIEFESAYDPIVKLKLLLDYGSDPNVKNMYGDTPLHQATNPDTNDEFIKILLENGADPNVKDKFGRTPLHFHFNNYTIPHNDNSSIVKLKLLLDYGADVNVKDNKGNTPLHEAIRRASINYEFIKILLENGADVNVKNEDGNTPIDIFNLGIKNKFNTVKNLGVSRYIVFLRLRKMLLEYRVKQSFKNKTLKLIPKVR